METPELDTVDVFLQQAREIYTIYEAAKDKWSSIDHRANALPLFIRAYNPDDPDDLVVSIDINDNRFKRIQPFKEAIRSFFSSTNIFWDANRDALKDAKKAGEDIAKKKRPNDEEEANNAPDNVASAITAMTKLAQALTVNADTKPTNDHPSKFRLEWIGLFQPEVDTFGEDVTSQGDKIVYRDVNIFIDSVKQAAQTHGDNLIASHLHLTLRGTAGIWYATLDDVTKSALKLNIFKWFEELRNRWEMSYAEAEERLSCQRYTVDDVRKGLSPYDYILAIKRYAAVLRLDNGAVSAKAYRGFDAVLRIHLTEPSRETDPLMVAEEARKKLSIWRELYPKTTYNRNSTPARFGSNYWQRETVIQSPLKDENVNRYPSRNQSYNKQQGYQQRRQQQQLKAYQPHKQYQKTVTFQKPPPPPPPDRPPPRYQQQQ